MRDQFQREITYLRISVTDLCNLRCRYCMPEEGVCKLRHEDVLSYEEITEIAAAAAELGVTKLRVTGGEPLVRPGVAGLCASLSALPGIREVVMTTNGVLLERYAGELARAGVRRVNVSLDTLDRDKYRRITGGGGLERVLAGIRAAEEAGMGPLKLNAVLIGGFNDDEIPAFAELTRDRDVLSFARGAASLSIRRLTWRPPRRIFISFVSARAMRAPPFSDGEPMRINLSI